MAVIGNESAAVAGALTLLFYSEEVHLICDKLQVTESLDYQVRESDVYVHDGRKVTQINGQNAVESISLDNGDQSYRQIKKDYYLFIPKN